MIALNPAPLTTRPARHTQAATHASPQTATHASSQTVTHASSQTATHASSQTATHASSQTVTPSEVEGQPESPSLEERIDTALAEALAKVKTPADDALAKQQQAFDQMMQLRTEQEREANAIREFGLAQQKKENDFLTEYIRMI